MTEHPQHTESNKQTSPAGRRRRGWSIGWTLFGVYLALLALGMIGEVFDVEWILNLPLFLPPGKF